MVLIKKALGNKLENLGVIIKAADPGKQIWEISNILVLSEISYVETGAIVFIACNKMGSPIIDAEFAVGWSDGITYPDQNYPGRYSMKMDHVYDPLIEYGPYWGGFLEEGIAPEVIGFGIPKKRKIEIKIVYSRLEGDV